MHLRRRYNAGFRTDQSMQVHIGLVSIVGASCAMSTDCVTSLLCHIAHEMNHSVACLFLLIKEYTRSILLLSHCFKGYADGWTRLANHSFANAGRFHVFAGCDITCTSLTVSIVALKEATNQFDHFIQYQWQQNSLISPFEQTQHD